MIFAVVREGHRRRADSRRICDHRHFKDDAPFGDLKLCAVFCPGERASPVVADALDDFGFFQGFDGVMGGLAAESAGGFADVLLRGAAIACLEAKKHHCAEDGGVRGCQALGFWIVSKRAYGVDVAVVASDIDDALRSFPDVGGIAGTACLFEHVAESLGGLVLALDHGEVGFGGDELRAVAGFPGEDAPLFAQGMHEVDFFEDWSGLVLCGWVARVYLCHALFLRCTSM